MEEIGSQKCKEHEKEYEGKEIVGTFRGICQNNIAIEQAQSKQKNKHERSKGPKECVQTEVLRPFFLQ